MGSDTNATQKVTLAEWEGKHRIACARMKDGQPQMYVPHGRNNRWEDVEIITDWDACDLLERTAQ